MSSLVADLVAAVGRDLGSEPVAVTRLGGGDVAEAVRLDLLDGRTAFAKTQADPRPGAFTTESSGLRWLGASGAVCVPEVLAVSDGSARADPPRLVLEWVEGTGTSRQHVADEERFGRQLADLHRAGAASFGREDRQRTGSRGLPNDPCDTWVEFFADRRLRPLARLASDTDGGGGPSLPPDVVRDLDLLADRLDRLDVPVEAPARLHGDLWAGNRIVDRSGRNWLVDPAAHGGHREFDLAMMALFGGFGAACFDAYDEAFPLGDAWRDRIQLHQVAPLVVHAIKFGGGYVAAAAAAIRRYL